MRSKSVNWRSRIVSVFLIFAIALCLIFFRPEMAIAANGSLSTMGAWETIPLASQSDRIQSVHTTLLPNGKS